METFFTMKKSRNYQMLNFSNIPIMGAVEEGAIR
jgi:hypothetical protein